MLFVSVYFITPYKKWFNRVLLYFKLNIKRILKVKSKNKTYIDLSLPNYLIKIYYKLNLRFFINFLYE